MANIITYNMVVDVLKDIATRHYQINTFFLGKDWEIGNNTDVLYPMLQMYPSLARMPISSQGEYKTVEFDLNCKVVDLVNQSEINERDVQSDTLRIAQDIVNELNQHPYYINSNASIIGDIQFDSLEEFEDDFAAGWAFTIRMRLININSYCGLPFAELDGYSANGPVSTGYSQSVSYLTCSNVLECGTLVDYIADEIDAALTGSTGPNYYTTGTTLFGNTIVYNRNDSMSAYTTDLTPIISAITDNNYYTTGATLNGNTVIFNRNDTMSAYTVNLSTLSPDLSGYLPTSGGTITGNLNVSGTTSLLDINYNDGNAAYGKILTSDANGNATWEYPITYATQIYMFSSANSSISGYEQAVVLPIYASATTASITSAVTTSETLIASFATNANYPNITFIPAGNILVHYETQKAAGSNNYYSYAKIYKRTTGGTETLLGISDNSSQTALNTLQQVTVSIVIGNTVLDVTDRIVVKVYAIMLSSSANITVFYDDNTNSRLELPVSVVAGTTSFVPYSGAIQDVDLGVKNLTAGVITANTYLGLPTDIRVTGGTYSNGTATFTNNTGGTFSVSGFSTSTGGSFTGGTVSGATNFTNGLTANTISATSISILTDLWTIELMDSRVATFYAPYSFKINSVTNILNSPTIVLFDDGAAYTLTNTIASGSKIIVSANTASVITLNGTIV